MSYIHLGGMHSPPLLPPSSRLVVEKNPGLTQTWRKYGHNWAMKQKQRVMYLLFFLGGMANNPQFFLRIGKNPLWFRIRKSSKKSQKILICPFCLKLPPQWNMSPQTHHSPLSLRRRYMTKDLPKTHTLHFRRYDWISMVFTCFH